MENILTKIDWKIINKYINNGLLISNKHPSKDIWILNYTNACAFEKAWDIITLSCRGLIVDKNGNIIGRSFPKFFNLGEHDSSDIPTDLSFEVFEKMDGSYINLFNYKGEWISCSRGSFTSDQAIKSKEILKNKDLNNLDKCNTYIFEIIY